MANPPTGFWAQRTPRERTLILAFILTFFVMGTAVLFYLRAGALGETRSQIDMHKIALTDVYTRGSVYKERLEAKKKREADIATDAIQFLTLVEEAQASVEDLVVSDQEEKKPLDLGDGLEKKSFQFKLRSISLEDALKFLTTLESTSGRIILTEQLVIRSPSASEDRINLDVTIATWERKTEEETDEEEEE